MLRNLVLGLAVFLSTTVTAGEHVNILVYHHVSESTPASTSLSPARFREHLQLLSDEGFTVIDLSEAIEGISNGTPLPEKSVAITFDDGYENIYSNAWPILKEFGYPFTIFIATDSIDQNYRDMMSWDQLRELKAAGVNIANHTTDHGYLVRHQDRNQAWLAATMDNIQTAQARIEAELGKDSPKWFAYPYGEFTWALADKLLETGYVAFAQHSGGFWSGSHMAAIPRFAAAGIYANPKTLLTKLNSKPMPVDETKLADMVTADEKPVLNAHLNDVSDMSRSLNCFVDSAWQVATWEGKTQFNLVSAETLSEGRHRYNCTSRAKSGPFYYWFSKPWLVLPETAK